MEWHDLHQPARSDRALCPGVELGVFGEYDADQKRRIDLGLGAFGDEGVGNPIRPVTVTRVTAEHLTDTECLLARSLRVDHCARQLQKLRRTRVPRMLLIEGPDRAAREKQRQRDDVRRANQLTLPL